METLMLILKIGGVLLTVFEVLLVLCMVALTIDYIRENRIVKKGDRNKRVGKHRATNETPLEAAKRALREEKERQAREDSFFGDWSYLLKEGDKTLSEEALSDRRKMDDISDTQNIKVFIEEI